MAALLDNPDFLIVTIGALVGVASSLLGTFLVLRRNSMLSDAISHSVVLGIVVVFLVLGTTSSPFYYLGAALAGILTVFLVERLSASGRVKDDAAIGLVFPALFALGVLLINIYARNIHLDVHAVLLGEIAFAWLDTVTVGRFLVPRSLVSLAVMTLVNALFIGLFYKELKLGTFDAGLARALGFRPVLLSYALLSLLSVTAVAAFEAVGAILFVAFVIVPPATAYLLTDRLWRMLLYGVLMSVASSLLGFYVAVALDVSIGGSMASMTGVFFLLALLLSPRYGLVAQEWRRGRQVQENITRTLLVHLYSHEADADGENAVEALQTHLHWPKGQAQRVMRRGLEKGFFEERAGKLYLTDGGRRLAQEVLEPWRYG